MKVHFIGIGGIGVSALAQYHLAKGDQVLGSDLAESEIITALTKKGAKITLGKNKAVNVPKDADLVVFSPAVEPTNPEFEQAKKLGIKTQSYPEALGELTKKYFTIAISGTHGKSTTTALVALILAEAGLDPTVIIGTKLNEFGESNFRQGRSRYLIIEADEWNASFLNYWPKIIILTNIEKEHMDFYKNEEHILKTYEEYISHLPLDGFLVSNAEDGNISKIKNRKVKYKIENYSIKQSEAENIRGVLKIPGEHNVANALAALTVARILKIKDEVSLRVLAKYQGAWRRFEIKQADLSGKKFTIVSDYGHHPTEVRATLQAVFQKFPNKKIWCVFQPHQYQRTFYLFDYFVEVLKNVPLERLIIPDIYSVAGRETKEIKAKVNSRKLVKAIGKESVIYLPLKKIKNYLKENLKGGEVVLIIGAGDIYNLVGELSEVSNI